MVLMIAIVYGDQMSLGVSKWPGLFDGDDLAVCIMRLMDLTCMI